MISHELTFELMVVIFAIGYFFITIEHYTGINKATVALLMAIFCWIVQFEEIGISNEQNLTFLGEQLADISQVVFFLLGALTVVEIINVHHGFRILSDMIRVRSKRKILWTVGVLTFFLSAVLDNLTTTIVMLSLMRKLVDENEDRLLIGGGIVIAANSGGAWTPIGDVTTTMLWIGGQISTLKVIYHLFLPSVISAVVALGCLSLLLKGDFPPLKAPLAEEPKEPLSNFIFFLGISSLIFVPIFKLLTGLPPFMGILFALGVMWLATDIAHRRYADRYHLRVPYVLSRIDLAGALFFLGILLCVDALDTAGVLKQLAAGLDYHIGDPKWIALAIGLASAVVDNVPLVAASMSMYSLERFPMDHTFWQLVAYCAGTGGSVLVIGSAAGVVFMGQEKVDFLWYVKRISLPALLGYLAGFFFYLAVA